MATPVFVNGTSGYVVVGSTTMNVTKWTFNHKVEALDVSHSGGLGSRSKIAGLLSADGSFDAVFDSANPFYLSPPAITPGTFATVKFYTATGSGFWTFRALIVGAEITSEVDGTVHYTCSFESDGAITVPLS